MNTVRINIQTAQNKIWRNADGTIQTLSPEGKERVAAILTVNPNLSPESALIVVFNQETEISFNRL